MTNWTPEQKLKVMKYGVCHICGAPRKSRIETNDKGVAKVALVCENGHSGW